MALQPGDQRVHAVPTTATATRSRSTPAPPTARAAPGTTPTCPASAARSSTSINAIDADVVSPGGDRELRRSSASNRDDAVQQARDGAQHRRRLHPLGLRPSPAAADLPPLAEQDVIRTALHLQPRPRSSASAPSEVLVGKASFDNAREPLAQAFKIRGHAATPTPSLWSSTTSSPRASGHRPDPDAATGKRSTSTGWRRPPAWSTSPTQFKAERGTQRMFLVGDFNSYSEEDPVQELERGVDNVAGSRRLHRARRHRRH